MIFSRLYFSVHCVCCSSHSARITTMHGVSLLADYMTTCSNVISFLSDGLATVTITNEIVRFRKSINSMTLLKIHKISPDTAASNLFNLIRVVQLAYVDLLYGQRFLQCFLPSWFVISRHLDFWLLELILLFDRADTQAPRSPDRHL